MLKTNPTRTHRSQALLRPVLLLLPLAAATACGDDDPQTEGTTGEESTTTSTTTTTTTGSGETDPASSSSAGTETGAMTTGSTGETGSGVPGTTTTGEQELSPIEQAIEAIGGEDDLSALESLEITANGARKHRFGGLELDDADDITTYDASYRLDLPGDSFRLDASRTSLAEALPFIIGTLDYTLVFNGDVGGFTPGTPFAPPGNFPSQNVAAQKKQNRLLNPHLILLDAIADPTIVSDIGMENVDGEAHHVIGIDDAVSEIRMFVDAQTGSISKLETLENHPLVRDVEIEVRYGDWTEFGPLFFPTSVELYSGGNLVLEETRSSVDAEADFARGTFDLPAEADNPTLDAGSFEFGSQTHEAVEAFFSLITYLHEIVPVAQSSQLVPGITLLAGPTNTLAISYDQGLIVVEAPTSPAHGSMLIDNLAATFPNSDLTHIIATHHHYDHSAGVRSFVAEGATAVVGAGSADFWEEVLSADSTIRPDALSSAMVTPAIEEVPADGVVSLGDANVTVDVHHLVGNVHSNDFVLPVVEVASGDRFVYAADVYNAGFGGTIALGGPQWFFGALRSLDLIDANCDTTNGAGLLVVPSHGVPLTLAESRAELESLMVDVGCPAL